MTRKDRIKALGDLARVTGEYYGWQLCGEDMPVRRSDVGDQVTVTWRRLDNSGYRYVYVSHCFDARVITTSNLGVRALLDFLAFEMDTTLKRASCFDLNGKASEPKKDAEALLPEWGEECL